MAARDLSVYCREEDLSGTTLDHLGGWVSVLGKTQHQKAEKIKYSTSFKKVNKNIKKKRNVSISQ